MTKVGRTSVGFRVLLVVVLVVAAAVAGGCLDATGGKVAAGDAGSSGTEIVVGSDVTPAPDVPAQETATPPAKPSRPWKNPKKLPKILSEILLRFYLCNAEFTIVVV